MPSNVLSSTKTTSNATTTTTQHTIASTRSNMVREIPHVVTTNKVSIDFLLNTPNSSFDCKKIAECLPAHDKSGGVDRLLTAASLLGSANQSRTTTGSSDMSSNSHSNTPYQSLKPVRDSREVVQSVKTKRRKRQNIQCELCGRMFGDSSSARKHHRVVHLKIKEFKCEECGKTFAEKSNRSKHYIAAHLNQRSHPCPDCNKVFNFTDGLRRHRNNVHLGLRPYPCEDCKTSYKQKTHLLKHRQSVHGIPIPSKKNNNSANL